MRKWIAALWISLMSMALAFSFLPAVSANGSFSAQYVSENASSLTLHPGETKSFWVDMKNTGTEPWLFGWPSHEVVLAHTNSSYTAETSSMFSGYNGWLSYSRPAAPNDSRINPGDIGRFEFQITGQEELGTSRMYLRPVKADGTFLNNLGIWVDLTIIPYPGLEAMADLPQSNEVSVSWEKYTGTDFASYRIYKFPKTYPELRYYAGGDWSKNFQYLPQLHPYYLDQTITELNTLSYTSSIEAEKSYVYIVDVCDETGNTIARSPQLDVRNVSSYTISPQERGQRIYYDPQLGDYRNTETRGYIESSMRWSTDSAETLLSLPLLPETYALPSAQELADFVKESMPRGLPTHRWADFRHGQGTSIYVDPQLKFDNGIYRVTGDLSVPRLTFQESTYGSSPLGALRFAYGYDGLTPIELTAPTTKEVAFDQDTNTMHVVIAKDEHNVHVRFDIKIRGGVIEVEGTLKPTNGSVTNPRLIVKALNDDGIGQSSFFESVKQWGSDSWLLYDDGQGFVRGEDVAKNNKSRFEGILQSNGSSYFKYNGTLSEGEVWQEYLEKIRFGSHMLGGTADAYEPTEYNSDTYDHYLFGRLLNYGYPAMGLASWSNQHPEDTEAREVLNDAIGLFYQNMLSYPDHNWSSFEDKNNGSLYWGELGPLLYGLSLMADVDSNTTIHGKTYAELAQFVYDRLPSQASGIFAVDNDGLGNAIYGIRKFKGGYDAKAADYESRLLTINAGNNQGYYTTKTYLGYENKQSSEALNALSHFLQLPQWDTEDALVIRNNLGYAGMGESQAWGQIVFAELAERYGGVYPILIGTDTRHKHQDIRMTDIGWNETTSTLNMSFDRSFEELDVYTGVHDLVEVKLNGAILQESSQYTFDESTHILRIMATNQATGAFIVEVTVE